MLEVRLAMPKPRPTLSASHLMGVPYRQKGDDMKTRDTATELLILGTLLFFAACPAWAVNERDEDTRGLGSCRHVLF